MNTLVKASEKKDEMYLAIDENLRAELEQLLFGAAEKGQFHVDMDQHVELFDRLRRFNFLELPLGFQFDIFNGEGMSVHSYIEWDIATAKNSTLVSNLIAKSLENFETHMSAEDESYLDAIISKINETKFIDETRIPFYDDEAAFIFDNISFFLANGFSVKNGLGNHPEISGTAEVKKNVVYLSVY